MADNYSDSNTSNSDESADESADESEMERTSDIIIGLWQIKFW